MPGSVPPPSYLSAQARAYLAQTFPAAEHPPIDDLEAWDEHVRQVDVGFGAMIGELDPAARTHAVDAPGVTITEVEAPDTVPSEKNPVCLDFHGGSLVFGGGPLAVASAANNARITGLTHWAVDYRMPPHCPFPAGLADAVAAYRALLAACPPQQIVVMGNSAGGNIAAALLLRAREEGLPMPARLVLLSPEVDLTESGDSFRTLAGVSTTLQSLMPINQLYAGTTELTDLLVSPLFGDLRGFPPTFLQAGTRDLFLSNAVRMHRALRKAGVPAELHVFDAMPHGGFGGSPEDEELHAEVRRFVHEG